MNIDCIPVGLFSWNFNLTDGHQKALLTFNWFSEQGIIKVGETEYEIQKQSLFSGRWNLVHRNEAIYQAHKPSPFSRKFEISGPLDATALSPTGLGRARTLQGPSVDLTISPNHPFTRRATISGQGDDFLQASFAFWLTALTWKRQANNRSSSSSGN